MSAFHNTYGLPIRVTEFNANPNRYIYIQGEFLKLAVPWMEQQDWIEAYSFFQPDLTYTDPNGDQQSIDSRFLTPDHSTVTALGTIYSNLESAPHLTENLMGSSSQTLPRP